MVQLVDFVDTRIFRPSRVMKHVLWGPQPTEKKYFTTQRGRTKIYMYENWLVMMIFVAVVGLSNKNHEARSFKMCGDGEDDYGCEKLKESRRTK